MKIFQKKESVIVLMILISIPILFSSCSNSDSNYKTTSNGLPYRIIVDAKKPKAKEGDIAEFTTVWRTSKDSVILNTSGKGPQYGEIYKPKFKGDPIEL